jgi:phosphoribosylformylglycinamidine synthase subunit PurQ / glutaminase
MKVAVIQFPGSNCERETLLALRRVGLEAEEILWNEGDARLKEFAAFVLIGGFSYEDRVRSGLIASMDPLMQALSEEAASGKAIFGICNGAQILVESGLVPGLPDHRVAMALAHNKRILKGQLVGTGFYNTWINIKASGVNPHNAFSSAALLQPMHIPAAHGEGRFILTPELYEALQKTDAVFYYYCDAEGEIIPEFPVNPNGAAFNLAGVSNARGNVLALMPHPERTPAGDALFMALKEYLIRWHDEGKKPLSNAVLKYEAPQLSFTPYELDETALHYWVGLNIHDNEALSLEKSLQMQGLPLQLKRYTHWQINGLAKGDSASAEKIVSSDFIFNRQKEYTLNLAQLKARGKKIFIIRPFEDEMALHKQNLLQHELKLPNIKKVTREVVWVVDAKDQDLEKVIQTLMTKPILGNPLAHQGFIL